jgi:phage terminase Nu1 subunit (DNA packaging protein)
MNISQRALATALGISPASITKLKRRGMPTHSAEAALEWRRRNVGVYIRCEKPAQPPAGTVAASPAENAIEALPAAGAVGLDLAQERAMLAREQRISIELKNATLRGEYAPISLLAEVLAAASQAVAERFDHLPGLLRRRCPTLPQAAMNQVLEVIATARNDWARATVELVRASMATTDDDEPDDAAAAAEDGGP